MPETATAAPPGAETTVDPLQVGADRRRVNDRMDNRTRVRAAKAGLAEPHHVDPRHTEHKGSRQRPHRRGAYPRPGISDEDSITVSRAPLVHEVTTGESVKFNRRPHESPFLRLPFEDRRRPEKGQEVTISGEIVHKHVDFLNTYIARLNGLTKIDAPPGTGAANMLEHLMAQPGFFADKALLDKLSIAPTPNNREVVEPAKIREFLSNGEAWAETELAMERFALMSEMGLGIETTINHKLYNRQSDDRLVNRATISEEDLKTLRGLIKTGISNSASTIGAIGYMIGGRGKTEYDFQFKKAVLAEMRNNASREDKALLFAFTGVDINRLDANGNPLHGGTTNVQNVERSITNVNDARRDLYTTLGLSEPPTNRWATKRRDVYRGRDIRTLQEFIYLEAQGRLNQGGNRPEGSQFAADRLVAREYGLLYDAAPTANESDRLHLMDQAIQRVRTRYAQDRVEREEAQREESRQEASLSAIKEKRKQMESGEFRKHRKEEQERRRDKAKEARDAAEVRRTELLEGEGSVGKTDAKVRSVETALSDLGVDVTGDISTAIETRIGILRNDIQDALTVAPVAGGDSLEDLVNQRSGAIEAAQNAIRDRWENAVRAAAAGAARGATINIPYPDADINAQEARINKAYEARIAPLELQYNNLRQQLADLTTRRSEYQQAVNEDFSATLTLAYAGGERDKLQNALDSHGRLLGSVVTLPGLAAANLTEDNINNLPAQVLVDALRTAPGGAVGADDAERLRWVYQAKAQERQRRAPLPGYQQNSITRLNTLPAPYAFSRDDILIRRPGDIIQVLRDRYEAGGLPTDPNLPISPANPALGPLAVADALTRAQADVRAARLGISRQLRELEETQLTAEAEHQRLIEADASAQIRNLENVEGLKAQAEVIEGVMAGQGETLSAARMLADVPRTGPGSMDDRLATLAEAAIINNADVRLTQAERDSGLPEGARRIYGFLFPGWEDAPNRQELFEAFRVALPPDRMAEMLNDDLGLGAAPGAPIADIFTRFYDSVTGAVGAPAPRPNQADMLLLARDMINYVRAVGGAI